MTSHPGGVQIEKYEQDHECFVENSHSFHYAIASEIALALFSGVMVERPLTPEVGGSGSSTPPRAPASPSNSWSSASTEIAPTLAPELSNCSDTPSHGSGGEGRPKRCKISREQLQVLIKSFEEEPLPNFDQRQALAKTLDMTPRSVQIWFQNRRQRLKPLQPKQSDGVGGRSHSPIIGQHMGRDGSESMQQLSPLHGGSGAAHRAAFGIPGLTAAANLCNGYHPSDMLMMSSLPHLRAAHQGSSFSMGCDYMEPFAATKALLGAGYHPSTSLASLSPRMHPLAAMAGAAAHQLQHQQQKHQQQQQQLQRPLPRQPQQLQPKQQPPPQQLQHPSMAPLPFGAAALPPPLAAAHGSPVMVQPQAPEKAPVTTKASPADGLLLLLACADAPAKMELEHSKQPAQPAGVA